PGETTHGDLERGGTLVVPDEPVAEAKRPTIERARATDPERSQTRPAEVLHRRQRAGAQHGQGGHDASRKRTTLPGVRRAGGEASAFQSGASVRPISCQPPGDDRGY